LGHANLKNCFYLCNKKLLKERKNMATATLRKKATSPLSSLTSGVRRTGRGENDKVRENNKEELWEKYISASPKDVPLTDEDIMEAVREVRYGKVADSH
jgi:hypothetical protein